jgi:predicted DNA-binding antitoxin AbrB/MazE fold protein
MYNSEKILEFCREMPMSLEVEATYENGLFKLDWPLPLQEHQRVRLTVCEQDAGTPEDQAWSSLGMDRLEEEWDNPEGAIYDDWQRLYGVQRR